MGTNFVVEEKGRINIPCKDSDAVVSLTLSVDSLVHVMDMAEDMSCYALCTNRALRKKYKRDMKVMATTIRGHLRKHYPDLDA